MQSSFLIVYCSAVDGNIVKTEGGATTAANTTSRNECYSIVTKLR